MASKNLNRDTVRLLRKIQKFLIAEPRRFSMFDGITSASPNLLARSYNGAPVLLEQPPCGTACCIAGAGYAIHRGITLNHTHVSWGNITSMFRNEFKMSEEMCDRLFYPAGMQGSGTHQHWSQFYSDMYNYAKTPIERACVGVARIEHFIATDGRE